MIGVPPNVVTLGDFYQLDPMSLVCTKLDESIVAGTAPSPRSSFGFTSANDRVFLFGGETYTGEACACPDLWF